LGGCGLEREREEARETGSAVRIVASMRMVKTLGAEQRLAGKYKQRLERALHWGLRHKILTAISFGIIIGANYLCSPRHLTRQPLPQQGRASFTSVLVIELVITRAIYALIGISNHFETFTKAFNALHKALGTINRYSIINASSDGGAKLPQLNGDISTRKIVFKVLFNRI